MGGRKLTTLSHQVKREICRHKEKNPGLTNKEISAWIIERFGEKVHYTTVSRFLKKSVALLSNGTANDMKRSKNPRNPAVDEAMYRWFLTAQEARLAISDELIMEKAKQMYEILLKRDPNMKECKFTTGWLTGFKKRHSISLRQLHGKADSVELTDETWEQFNVLKASLSSYEDCDVFNMDEIGLFYELQPNRSLRDQSVSGQKKQKDRLTVALTANMDGSIKLPPLVINKALMPQAFSQRRIELPDNLGIEWYANKNAWMTGLVFQNWLLKFENRMKALGRSKVALLLDNAPGHLLGNIAEQLTVVKVFFLPAITTARFQPMDAGIMQSFKCQYRRLFIRRQLADLEKQEHFKIDMYDAVSMIVRAWTDGVTQQTIRNCWEHCDLVPRRDQRQGRARGDFDLMAEVDDPDTANSIKDLAEQMSTLSLQYPVTLTVEEYLEADGVKNAPTFPVDGDIAYFLVHRIPEDDRELPNEAETQLDPEETQDVDGDVTVIVPQISFADGMAHFDAVKVFLQQQDFDTYAFTLEINKMMKAIDLEHMKGLVQSNLD